MDSNRKERETLWMGQLHGCDDQIAELRLLWHFLRTEDTRWASSEAVCLYIVELVSGDGGAAYGTGESACRKLGRE